ncbi:hypothetical protein yaldo0001_22150, partial [Yersinia aldovae ATCC 35236]
MMPPDINTNWLLNNKTQMRRLILLLLIISPLVFAENRPGFVCGKFNG